MLPRVSMELSRPQWAINQLEVSHFAFGAGVKFHSAAGAKNPLPCCGGVTLRHVEASEALTVVGLPWPPHWRLLVPQFNDQPLISIRVGGSSCAGNVLKVDHRRG